MIDPSSRKSQKSEPRGFTRSRRHDAALVAVLTLISAMLVFLIANSVPNRYVASADLDFATPQTGSTEISNMQMIHARALRQGEKVTAAYYSSDGSSAPAELTGGALFKLKQIWAIVSGNDLEPLKAPRRERLTNVPRDLKILRRATGLKINYEATDAEHATGVVQRVAKAYLADQSKTASVPLVLAGVDLERQPRAVDPRLAAGVAGLFALLASYLGLLRNRRLEGAEPSGQTNSRVIADAPPLAPELADANSDDSNAEEGADEPLVELYAVATAMEELKSGRIVVINAPSLLKAPTAAYIARSLSHNFKTVLVDISGQGAVHRALGEPGQLPGIMDVLAGSAQLPQVLCEDPSTPLHLVPAGNPNAPLGPQSGDLLVQALAALDEAYDFVVLDAAATGLTGLPRLTNRDSILLMGCSEAAREEADRLQNAVVDARMMRPVLMNVRQIEHDEMTLHNLPG